MPRTQFEALEAHCQARGERSVDSNKSTVNDDDNDNDDAEDAGNPQGEPALLKTRIRENTVDMFKRDLLFSQGAVEALYDDQMITTLDILRDLNNKIIKELCCTIRKPGGDVTGHQISKLSMTC